MPRKFWHREPLIGGNEIQMTAWQPQPALWPLSTHAIKMFISPVKVLVRKHNAFACFIHVLSCACEHMWAGTLRVGFLQGAHLW